MYETATFVEFAGRRGQDRVDVVAYAGGSVLVLADGSGGSGNGAAAADAVLMWVRAHVSSGADLSDARGWEDLLRKIDFQISCDSGESTGVLVNLMERGLVGACVGDSAAWVINEAGVIHDLTARQVHKPLLGSGAARVVSFVMEEVKGTVLLGSDGLIKYAPRARISEVSRGANLQRAARQLVDLTRLKSGALSDDVGVVLARRRGSEGSLRQAGRRRFTLGEDGELREDGAE